MSKIKIEIKSWLNGSVLFEYESENATMRKAVEAAIADGADLRGADLRDANLRDADLRGADLRGADLRDANLSGADLRDADLRGADLRGANLSDANLSGANLRDADLRGATIYYADDDFDTEYRKDRLIRGTQLDEIETEMQHDVPSCRGYFVTWKNVLKIKSWKLKSADTTTKAAPQAEEEIHLMKGVTGRPEIAIGVPSPSNTERRRTHCVARCWRSKTMKWLSAAVCSSATRLIFCQFLISTGLAEMKKRTRARTTNQTLKHKS